MIPGNHYNVKVVGKYRGVAYNVLKRDQVVYGATVASDMKTKIYDKCIIGQNKYGSYEVNGLQVLLKFSTQDLLPATSARTGNRGLEARDNRKMCHQIPTAVGPVDKDCYKVIDRLFGMLALCSITYTGAKTPTNSVPGEIDSENSRVSMYPEECFAASVDSCSGFVCSYNKQSVWVYKRADKRDMTVEIHGKCVTHGMWGSYGNDRINMGLYPVMPGQPYNFNWTRMAVEELVHNYNRTTGVAEALEFSENN